VRLDVVLLACADAIKAGERLQPGEDLLDTCSQVSMRPLFDRLKNIRLFNITVLTGSEYNQSD
jgi:hypothetical protein